MATITQEMKDIFEKCRPYIFTTASKDGKPNGVPIGMARIISDDEVLLADNFMNKTRKNLAENPWTAITFWSQESRLGYQFKGRARVEESGKHLEDLKRGMRERKAPFSPKAVVIVKVEEIYYVGGGGSKDTGKRVDLEG
jgi:predicted pyridoxine 5'-phosphate oxidase superfamily flavin-nucleotide-binding protein